MRGLSFEHEKDVPLHYKGLDIGYGYRLDFLVEQELIVEVKAVERLLPVHEAQVLSYLRLARVTTGLLLNFHTEVLRSGLRRLTLNPPNFPFRSPRLPASLLKNLVVAVPCNALAQ
jgi:GxxExxY protein